MSDNTPEWIKDVDDECWILPGVIEPEAGSTSGCMNCYPILKISPEHRALIAAAPELLEACEAMQHAMFYQDDTGPAQDMIITAIAKATEVQS